MRSFRLFLTVLASVCALAAIAIGVAAECARSVVTNEDIERAQYINGLVILPSPTTSKSWFQLERKSASGAYGTGIIDTAFGAPAGGGVGSFHTTTADGTSKVTLLNLDYQGKPLSGLQDLSYYTYRNAGSGDQLPALNIWIDIDNDGLFNKNTDPVLVYEPVYNNTEQAVVSNQWQKWDAYSGRWWVAAAPLNGICTGATYSCMQTLSTIVSNNPNATIGGIGINQGGGNNGLEAAADLLSITYNGECSTYDFEPYRVAATQDDCKNSGYKNVKTAGGQPFKNQGQCVSYVESNRGGNK